MSIKSGVEVIIVSTSYLFVSRCKQVIFISFSFLCMRQSADVYFMNQEGKEDNPVLSMMSICIVWWLNSPRKPLLVRAFGTRRRTCRKPVSDQSCSTSCRQHVYLMLSGNEWNMRGIMEVNEHIQQALYLLSPPWGPLLHYFRCVWEGEGEIQTAWLTDRGLIFFINGFRLIKTDLPY